MSRKKSLYFGAFVLALVVVVCFQNCSAPSGGSSGVSVDGRVAYSGTGDSYDGKRSYDRNIPGFTCDSQSVPHSTVQINQGKLWLVRNTNGACGKSSEIADELVVRSPNTADYVGYEAGVYAKSEAAQAEKARGIFVEMWCRDLNSASLRDFIIKWDQNQKVASAQVFDREKWPQGSAVFSVNRRLEMDSVRYYGSVEQEHLSFLIDNSLKHPDSPWEVRGTVQTALFGSYQKYTLACRKGGEFDSEAPQFHYAQPVQVLPLGRAVSLIAPVINKVAIEYEISPALPAGLAFDSKLGAISGTPSATSPSQTYVVTAKIPFGAIVTQIDLGVGREFRVSTTSDSADLLPGDGQCLNSQQRCSLRAALEEANANSGAPVLVHIPTGSYRLALGQLVLNGTVFLQGEGLPVLDARNLSRHMQVTKGSRLRLQGLKLINGRPGDSGAAIYATEASLLIEDSVFTNNWTNSEDARGGAIYLSQGSLVVNRSQFISNKTDSSGSNIQGGAIFVDGRAGMTKIRASKFEGNSSASGGAIYSENDMYIEGCEFSKNKAMEGGALNLMWGDSIIDNSKFTENETSFEGGAIDAFGFLYLWIKNSSFAGNRGQDTIYSDGTYDSVLRIYESSFIGNKRTLFTERIFPDLRYPVLELRWFSAHLRGTHFEGNEMMDSCKLWFSSYGGGFLDLGGNFFDQSPCQFQ